MPNLTVFCAVKIRLALRGDDGVFCTPESRKA
jgi:hypothetical protein